MLWQAFLDSIGERVKEPDMSSRNTRYMTGLPYLIKDELEHVVHMAATQVLREVEQADWESFSSDAIQTLTGAPGLNLPLNMVRVLGASVDGQASVLTSPASFYQRLGQTRYTNHYALLAGRCEFQGASITLRILVEPPLDTWRVAQTPILPAGSDIRVIDLAVKRILISDYVPEWRA